MNYPFVAIPEAQIPRAAAPIFQHMLDTYASETNKVISVWREFSGEDLVFRPHRRSSSVEEVMKHELLSQRRFFGEFLGAPEPPADETLPPISAPEDFSRRLLELALPRLAYFAPKNEAWWLERVAFFDVERERVWIFWRRLLHTAHHRTQLAVCLRRLGKRVPPIYGPTADATWKDADPTTSVEAAGRRAPGPSDKR
ncbi:MAG: DinB family protein [Terriglobia bacterium]